MRSFNLGVPSMFLPESLFVIDRLLAQRHARLRWMFIELDDPLPRLEEHAGLVAREVYWHGWRETALACANILTTPGIHTRERVLMLVHQGMLYGRCRTHVGCATEWLARRMSPEARKPPPPNSRRSGPTRTVSRPIAARSGRGKARAKTRWRTRRAFLPRRRR